MIQNILFFINECIPFIPLIVTTQDWVMILLFIRYCHYLEVSVVLNLSQLMRICILLHIAKPV